MALAKIGQIVLDNWQVLVTRATSSIAEVKVFRSL